MLLLLERTIILIIRVLEHNILYPFDAHCDNEYFAKNGIFDIAIDTEKEDELFDYIDIATSYSKENLENCKINVIYEYYILNLI